MLNGSGGLNEASPPRPSRWLGRCVTVLFVTNCVLALWSLTVSEFVPSSFGRALSLAVAIGLGMLMGIWTYVDPVYAHDTPERAARLATAPALANPVVRVLFIGAFTGLIAYEAASGAAFEFWTLAVGQQGEQTMHLGDYQSSSRYNCAGFKLQEAPFKAHRIVCARYGDDEAPPAGTPVTVRGQVSALGIRIEQFQISSGP